jgi:hypothetical protein
LFQREERLIRDMKPKYSKSQKMEDSKVLLLKKPKRRRGILRVQHLLFLLVSSQLLFCTSLENKYYLNSLERMIKLLVKRKIKAVVIKEVKVKELKEIRNSNELNS